VVVLHQISLLAVGDRYSDTYRPRIATAFLALSTAHFKESIGTFDDMRCVLARHKRGFSLRLFRGASDCVQKVNKPRSFEPLPDQCLSRLDPVGVARKRQESPRRKNRGGYPLRLTISGSSDSKVDADVETVWRNTKSLSDDHPRNRLNLVVASRRGQGAGYIRNGDEPDVTRPLCRGVVGVALPVRFFRHSHASDSE
jgi:hypothetical protein